MPLKKHNRQYDLIVLGATGYTGGLVAHHISKVFPSEVKWAVAGRSADKLQQLVSELEPAGIKPEIEVCNVNDAELAILARKTFCLITTLGPYTRSGEPAFKACAEAGTHYLDCTGEVPFTLAMIKKYDAVAKTSGAWMFPQNGLESGPSDLLTWALVSTIRTKLSSQACDVVMDLYRNDSAPSGGTLASFLTMFELFPARVLLQALKPYALSPILNTHPAPKKSFVTSATGLIKVPGLGLLTTSVTGAMNAAIVSRTWGLTQLEPSLQKHKYGPKFTYREFEKTRSILTGIIAHYGLILGATLLLFSPFRALIGRFSFEPGEGPDKDEARKDFIEFRAVAKPDIVGTEKQAFGRMEYKGSMYYLTAALLAQGAATILWDENINLKGGIYTPACLGQGYIDRLKEVGVHFETEIRDF